MGRPTSRTPEIEEEICDRIADGESLRAICGDKGMPCRQTVLRWMAADEAFATKCAHARELQADALEEAMSEIEEKTLSGDLDPRAASVVLSSRRWRAEKLAPKKYGARTSMELTGANGGPVQISDTERAAKISAILAAAQARKDGDVSDPV